MAISKTLIGNIKGPKGDPGKEGPRGSEGAQGPKGDKGDTPSEASDMTAYFQAASERINIESGEKLSEILGKIKKLFSDLKMVAFSGNYDDLYNKPDPVLRSGGEMYGLLSFNWNNTGKNLELACGEHDSFVISNKGNLWLKAGNGSDGVGIQFCEGTFCPVFAADFVKASSNRYKENIQPVTEERARRILHVQVVTYDYRKGITAQGSRYDRSGVIAEQTAKIIPEAVSYMDTGDGQVPVGVDYSSFVPYLIRMVQIQQDQIREIREHMDWDD